MSDQNNKGQRSLNPLRTVAVRDAGRFRPSGGRRESGVVETGSVLAALQQLGSGERELHSSSVAVSLDAFGAAALLVDAHGTVLAANLAATKLLESCGIHVRASLFHLPEGLWSSVAATELGEAYEFRPSSQPNGLSITRYGAGVQRYVLVLRALGAAGEELARRLHRQRLEITGRLVAMIAHDLRVPLASILFNADAGLERPLKGDEVGMVLRDIRAAADTIRASIDNLLDFACLGGAQSTAVDLGAVVERVKSLLRPTMRDGGHRLNVNLAPNARSVCGNALVIEQVVVNLVLNAMQATDQPVSIDLSSAVMDAAVAPSALREPGGKWVVGLAVHDDGPGIPSPLRDQVFEPFFTTKQSGIGLGLPMAREASASMGGALTLEPSATGARFVLWLRLAGQGEALRA